MSRVIKVNVGTGWANGDHNDELELPDGWDDWEVKEQDEYLNDCAVELLHNSCDCAAWVEGED